jgi:N-acetylmuramoyl-L-alanine amidase
MTTPEEAPPRDVTTTNRANAQSSESSGHGEFDKAEEEQDVRGNAAASRSRGTASSSSDMAGWELVRYQERDYVPATSIHKFYRFNTLEADGNNVWFRSPVLVMKATLGSQDLLINNIKFVLSDPVIELQGKPCFSRLDLCKLIDPVLRPSYIGSGSTFDTVILDPGHGGHDSGARGIYGYEKDFALKLAFALKADLEKRGLKVLMTRRDDTYISLGGRVAYANKIPNSVYVSLHFNSGQSSATGIETFAFTPQGASSEYGARAVDAASFNGNQRDSENIALATAIHASVVHHFRFVDRGVKRARWYVLKGLERPGVLFEGGFVTNINDAKFIAADNFRTELATTLGQAIVNYRRALQPVR